MIPPLRVVFVEGVGNKDPVNQNLKWIDKDFNNSFFNLNLNSEFIVI